jgi:SagB-type dehydrogenase family enzyme
VIDATDSPKEEFELQAGVGGDRRGALGEAALGQAFIAAAPASVVIAAVYGRTTRKYGERGVRYVHMEAGHAAQNACLECTALGLGTVPVGAFHDGAVSAVLGLADGVEPLYLMPVGHPG